MCHLSGDSVDVKHIPALSRTTVLEFLDQLRQTRSCLRAAKVTCAETPSQDVSAHAPFETHDHPTCGVGAVPGPGSVPKVFRRSEGTLRTLSPVSHTGITILAIAEHINELSSHSGRSTGRFQGRRPGFFSADPTPQNAALIRQTLSSTYRKPSKGRTKPSEPVNLQQPAARTEACHNAPDEHTFRCTWTWTARTPPRRCWHPRYDRVLQRYWRYVAVLSHARIPSLRQRQPPA